MRSFRQSSRPTLMDIESARSRGRSTTRLEVGATMRSDMIAGLMGWASVPPPAETPSSRWSTIRAGNLRLVRAPLGVVAFVFEGRPNVFADACGVLRSGEHCCVPNWLRCARDCERDRRTPRSVLHWRERGCRLERLQLVESSARSAGHALFSDRRLALAVARGSGAAVAQLGAVASQAGIPVSLHGTGGAWIMAGQSCDPSELRAAVRPLA